MCFPVFQTITDCVLYPQVQVTSPLEGETETGRSEQPELLPPSVPEDSLHQHHRQSESKPRSHHRLLTTPTPTATPSPL